LTACMAALSETCYLIIERRDLGNFVVVVEMRDNLRPTTQRGEVAGDDS